MLVSSSLALWMTVTPLSSFCSLSHGVEAHGERAEDAFLDHVPDVRDGGFLAVAELHLDAQAFLGHLRADGLADRHVAVVVEEDDWVLLEVGQVPRAGRDQVIAAIDDGLVGEPLDVEVLGLLAFASRQLELDQLILHRHITLRSWSEC
jgi:hypothetical protein